MVGSDSVSLNSSGASATFDNANIGTTHTVTASGYGLTSGNGNADAGNYTLTQPTATNVTISPALAASIILPDTVVTVQQNPPAIYYGTSSVQTGLAAPDLTAGYDQAIAAGVIPTASIQMSAGIYLSPILLQDTLPYYAAPAATADPPPTANGSDVP